MSYRELFSALDSQRVVFFEDDFSQRQFNMQEAFYGMVRMDIGDRKLLLDEIKESVSEELSTQLCSFLIEFDGCFDSIKWEEIPRGYIVPAFTAVKNQNASLCEKIEQLYSKFHEEDIREVYEKGEKYGVGIKAPPQYECLFDDYIFYDSRAKSIRIYKDYDAAIKKEFQIDIGFATDDRCIVCIIDNQLKGINRAQEIIETIKGEEGSERKNIVGSVFSSNDAIEERDKDIYFEFTQKDQKTNLEASIARSAYAYFIYELKKNTLGNLENAFNKVLENKGIAFFLSQKAKIEGESEYQIVKDWIQLLLVDSQTNTAPIKHLIALSKVINLLEDSQENYDEELHKYNTYEAFDYSVNEFFLPVASGDVFKDDDGNWYVLIGQDCDMARRPKKSPNNALAELLPAELCLQSEFNKFKKIQNTALIYNFRERKETESRILKVKYQERKYIANEIISLCAFNQDGRCKIHSSDELPNEMKKLMPEYMVEYYKEVQKFYKSIDEIKESAGVAFDFINSKEFTPRLISISNYENNDGIRQFKLSRVCRLTHSYVFYLYKLFLEYRGRQPFQTINLVRQDQISRQVKFNGEKKDFSVPFIRISNPGSSNETKWPWIIDEDDINSVLKQLGIDSPVKSVVKVEGKPEEKQYVLQNEEKLYINQEKEYICFTKR